jgi:anti-sigma factor RsiW
MDGELSELEEALLEKHLEGCPSCDAFVARLVSTTEAVRAAPAEWPEIEYPRFARHGSRLAVGRRAAIVAVVVAAALGALVGSFFQRPGPASKPASVPQVSLLTTDMNDLRQLPRYTRRPEPAPVRIPGKPSEGVI